MRRHVALAAALLGLAACNSNARALDRANALLHDKKPADALKGYQGVLAELGEGPLSAGDAELRLTALKHAADVSFLELGDYQGALSYYRRIVLLYPGSDEAMQARGVIGDIYFDQLHDPVGAIAQYADVAQSASRDAPRYQMKVARMYLELKNYSQARLEARALRERWPASEYADDAQLLTAQAWALEGRQDEALGAFQACIDRKPKPDILSRALEGEAHVYAQRGQLDHAIELYEEALPSHPNPDAVRVDLEAVKRRREQTQTATPGDKYEAFDHDKVKPRRHAE